MQLKTTDKTFSLLFFDPNDFHQFKTYIENISMQENFMRSNPNQRDFREYYEVILKKK